jgi:hypothetical protein
VRPVFRRQDDGHPSMLLWRSSHLKDRTGVARATLLLAGAHEWWWCWGGTGARGRGESALVLVRGCSLRWVAGRWVPFIGVVSASLLYVCI